MKPTQASTSRYGAHCLAKTATRKNVFGWQPRNCRTFSGAIGSLFGPVRKGSRGMVPPARHNASLLSAPNPTDKDLRSSVRRAPMVRASSAETCQDHGLPRPIPDARNHDGLRPGLSPAATPHSRDESALGFQMSTVMVDAAGRLCRAGNPQHLAKNFGDKRKLLSRR